LKRLVPIAAVLLAFGVGDCDADLILAENFSTNPLGNWTFGVGSNANAQFTYQTDVAAYAGDAAGSLKVHFDSSLPTSRLQLPLGFTLGPTTDFTVSARFSLANVNALPNQAMQFAFGLVNTAATGGNRTGSSTSSANTFHTVGVDYFPNVSPFHGWGATLTPSIFGAQKNAGSIWANYATIFGSGSDLGDNATGIPELPQSTNLQLSLSYAAGTHAFTLSLAQIAPNGSLTTLVTEVPVLDLDNEPTYDPTLPFSVNALAIMAYQDGFNTANPPTLTADATFQKLSVTVSSTFVQSLPSLTVHGGTATLTSALGTGSSSITVNPGTTLAVSASQTLSSLTIGAGATVKFTSGGGSFSGASGSEKTGALVPEPGVAALVLLGAAILSHCRRRLA